MKIIGDLQNRLWFQRGMTTVFFLGMTFLAVTLLATGCDNPQPVPEPDSPPALLYKEKCNICHPAYHPQTHTSLGWKKVIPRMEKNAEATGMGTLLSEEERSIILNYLVKHSRKGY
ncbi:MAG: hypothetical protein IT392_05240 [Nitrospirae bacterium]|nr:hypothetical protein [Nitrospirota bacterium]